MRKITKHAAFNEILTKCYGGKNVSAEDYCNYINYEDGNLQDVICDMGIQPYWLSAIGIIESIELQINCAIECGNIEILAYL